MPAPSTAVRARSRKNITISIREKKSGEKEASPSTSICKYEALEIAIVRSVATQQLNL
jgi:hypothetical protein